MQDGGVLDFNVNNDWTMADLCKYLVLCVELQVEFTFMIDEREICKQREPYILCREI